MSIKKLVSDALRAAADNMTPPVEMGHNWYVYMSNAVDVCIYGSMEKAIGAMKEEQAMHAAHVLGVDFQQAKMAIDGQHIHTWRQALEYCFSLRYCS